MSKNRSALQIALAVALAKASMSQTDLALMVGWRPSTMNGWLRGIGKPPPNFVEQLESALGIPRGSLARALNHQT
jgi:ribosome-binding protein aMBF1 (putative translation factor)